MDFLLYSFYNSNFKAEHLGSKKSTARLCNAGIALLEYFRRTARKELTASMHFTPPSAINELAQMAKGFVSLGNQTGEGWFLTGEMLELIHSGVNNTSVPSPLDACPTTSSARASLRNCAGITPSPISLPWTMTPAPAK